MAAKVEKCYVAYQRNYVGELVAVEIMLIRRDAEGLISRKDARTLANWLVAKMTVRIQNAADARLGQCLPAEQMKPILKTGKVAA